VAEERLSLDGVRVLFLGSNGTLRAVLPSRQEDIPELNPRETLLAQWSAADPTAHSWRGEFSGVAMFRPFDVGAGAPVWRSQQVRPASVPGPNGEDLLAALQTLRSRSPGLFDNCEAALRAGFPAYQALDLEPVGAGQVALAWRERGQTYYAHELSEGTLRFLWLCTILHSSDPPRMVLIDEPEVSLHPELLKILSDLLDDASHRTQLLVATQSPELVSWLKPEQVVVLDLDEEGWTKATPATELDLDEWLKRYTLGELWVQGTIGGRP
jgi:predicted ATPase